MYICSLETYDHCFKISESSRNVLLQSIHKPSNFSLVHKADYSQNINRRRYKQQKNCSLRGRFGAPRKLACWRKIIRLRKKASVEGLVLPKTDNTLYLFN